MNKIQFLFISTTYKIILNIVYLFWFEHKLEIFWKELQEGSSEKDLR